MKSLTFSCLICALNLFLLKSCSERQSLLEVARTAKSCSKAAEHNRERPTCAWYNGLSYEHQCNNKLMLALENQFDEKRQDWLVQKFWPFPGVQTLERGRKIHEKKNWGAHPPPPPPPSLSRCTITLTCSPPCDCRALLFEHLEQPKKIGLWRLQRFDAILHFSSSRKRTIETWLLVVLRITTLTGALLVDTHALSIKFL